MGNHFVENIFLSWVFGAVICDMYNSIDVHASTVSPFCWKLKIHIFAILWRMKSDLSSLFTRMSRLGVSFLPKPHTQFVSRNGTEVSQKTISADRQTSCKDLYLDYQGRGKLSETHLRWALFTCAVSAWTATSQLLSRLTTTTTWTPGSYLTMTMTITMTMTMTRSALAMICAAWMFPTLISFVPILLGWWV